MKASKYKNIIERAVTIKDLNKHCVGAFLMGIVLVACEDSEISVQDLMELHLLVDKKVEEAKQ